MKTALQSRTIKVAIGQAAIGVIGILTYLATVLGNPDLTNAIVGFLKAMQINADPVLWGSIILILKSAVDYYLRSITTGPLE